MVNLKYSCALAFCKFECKHWNFKHLKGIARIYLFPTAQPTWHDILSVGTWKVKPPVYFYYENSTLPFVSKSILDFNQPSAIFGNSQPSSSSIRSPQHTRTPRHHQNNSKQCAEQQESASNFSKYCACHEKWLSWSILFTHETLFTMRGATRVIVQTHQILRLPRKMNLMIDPCHTWNAIYNARNNRWHPPTSPNTAPATQNDCHDWSSSHMKRYLQCAEQQVASSNITKYCACHAKWFSKISQTFLQNRWNVNYNARPIRAGSEQDPSRKPSSATRLATEVTFQDHHEHFVLKNTTFRAPAIIPNFTEYCACHEKWHFNFTEYCACHAKWLASLLLMTCMSHVIYNAQRNSTHPPTSLNTAPATQNETHDWSAWHRKRYLQCAEQQVASSNITKYCACHAKWLSWYCHDWSSSHMKRYLQCAEQQVASSNITKYCACHAKWVSKISQTFLQNRWNVNYNARPIRAGSEQDPSRIRAGSEQETVIRNPPRNRGYFSGPPRAFCIEKYNISRSGYHSKFHRILRLPRKVTLQLHRILRLPRKMTVMILSWLILVTYETLFTMRGTTGGILQHHQILRLPRKMILQNFTNISPKQMKRQLQCATDPSWIRAGSEQETVIRNPPRNRGYFSGPPRAFCIEKYNISRSGYHSKFHRILRLPRKVTLQLHRILRLPRKVTLERHQIMHLPRKVTLERLKIVIRI